MQQRQLRKRSHSPACPSWVPWAAPRRHALPQASGTRYTQRSRGRPGRGQQGTQTGCAAARHRRGYRWLRPPRAHPAPISCTRPAPTPRPPWVPVTHRCLDYPPCARHDTSLGRLGTMTHRPCPKRSTGRLRSPGHPRGLACRQAATPEGWHRAPSRAERMTCFPSAAAGAFKGLDLA